MGKKIFAEGKFGELLLEGGQRLGPLHFTMKVKECVFPGVCSFAPIEKLSVTATLPIFLGESVPACLHAGMRCLFSSAKDIPRFTAEVYIDRILAELFDDTPLPSVQRTPQSSYEMVYAYVSIEMVGIGAPSFVEMEQLANGVAYDVHNDIFMLPDSPASKDACTCLSLLFGHEVGCPFRKD